jgi:GNAT superfamily N-acetyltransferase
VNIERWDPLAASDDELRAHHAFDLEIEAERDPETPPAPFELWRQQALTTTPFHETLRWVARDGEALAAAASLELGRTGDNAHLGEFDIGVAVSRRRTGIARELLARIVDAAAADGRTTLLASTPKDTGGEGFLGAVGCEQAYLERRSRLRVKEVDQSLVDGWIADAKAKASDYTLLLFDGPVPDEHLEGVIDIHTAMNDAPREGLALEDERETPEQFRDGERRLAELGSVRMQVVARHDPTGQLAGFSTLSWNPLRPQVVWQWGTAVRREHRGHAIGRWLKAANFNNLLERNPDAEFVDTWNAGSNQWMLAINDDLGFRPYIWYTAWQATVEEIRAAIAS